MYYEYQPDGGKREKKKENITHDFRESQTIASFFYTARRGRKIYWREIKKKGETHKKIPAS